MSLSAVLVANGFPENLSNPLHANMTIVMGTLTIFITWICVKCDLWKKKLLQIFLINIFYQQKTSLQISSIYFRMS